MRVKYDESTPNFQRIERPVGGRFRRTTYRKRKTRADLVREVSRVRAELGVG